MRHYRTDFQLIHDVVDLFKFPTLKFSERKFEKDPVRTFITQFGKTLSLRKISVKMHLRAEYGPMETPTPTHITFYANNGSDENRDYPDLQINEKVDILYPGYTPADDVPLYTGYTADDVFPVYPGHKFLGWARINEASLGVPGYNPVNPDRELTADDLWLEYVEDDNSFIVHEPEKPNADGKSVKQVAADERQPYHDLFAVWEKKNYN